MIATPPSVVLPVLVMACLLCGCGAPSVPLADRYVGTWESGEDLLLIQRNGLGRGRVFRGRHTRQFSWEQGVDRITITFDGNRRPEVFQGRIDAAGGLVVSSPRTSVTLRRVAAPGLEFPDADSSGGEAPPDAPPASGAAGAARQPRPRRES